MKKSLLLFPLLVAALCSGCNKECHCYGYDGTHHYYSTDEVADADKSCSSMIYQANMRYYSYCEWDY